MLIKNLGLNLNFTQVEIIMLLSPLNSGHFSCESRVLEEGVPWHPSPEKNEISSPQKCDFYHSEAKSECFNISFFKVGSNLVMNFYFFLKKNFKNDCISLYIFTSFWR